MCLRFGIMKIRGKTFKIHRLAESNFEAIGQQKQTRVILAIFQTGPGWLCPVSTAFKNPLLDFKHWDLEPRRKS